MKNIEEELNVVHEKDLEILLKQLGKYDDLISGKLKCKFCGQQISISNLYSVLPESGSVNFVSDNPECITKLLEHLENKKK